MLTWRLSFLSFFLDLFAHFALKLELPNLKSLDQFDQGRVRFYLCPGTKVATCDVNTITRSKKCSNRTEIRRSAFFSLGAIVSDAFGRGHTSIEGKLTKLARDFELEIHKNLKSTANSHVTKV